MDESVAKILRYDQNTIINGVIEKKAESYILPWLLADISYYAILHTNDFVLNKINEHQFIELYGAYQNFEKKDINTIIKMEDSDESKFFYILFGLSQKSFWYQDKTAHLKTFVRLYDLLINTLDKSTSDEITNICGNKMSCNLDSLFKSCLFLTLLTGKLRIITFPMHIDISLKKLNINNKILYEIIQLLSDDYYNYRHSSLEAKYLHIKPIIKNLKNEYIILNAFLYSKMTSTFPYWFIRNNYREKNNKDINQKIGYSFESYVDKLLARYLKSKSYRRIKEKKKEKRADLEIKTQKYHIFLEQKFQIVNISMKDTIFDLKSFDRSLSELRKASKQLMETSQKIKSDKEKLLLILTFDDFYLANDLIKKRIQNQIKDYDISDIYFINIDEFEMLIQLLHSDENLFNKVVNKVKVRSKRNNNESLEFGFIMKDMNLYENNFIASRMKDIVYKETM